MSSSKRRKLNETPSLSAFTARSSLNVEKRTPNTRKHAQIEEAKVSSAVAIEGPFVSNNGLGIFVSKDAAAAELTMEREKSGGGSHGDDNKTLDSEQDAPNSSFQSRAVSPEALVQGPTVVLSTFRPNKGNMKETEEGSLTLKIAPGERLVVLGAYDLSIQKGQVTLQGATLGPSGSFYRVFAPSTHSLPVLRCLATDLNDAEIKLRQCDDGLDSLKSLSSLFGKLWNDDTGPLGPEYSSLLKRNKKTTFQILYSSKDVPQRTYIQPIVSTPEWNQALSRFPVQSNQKTSVIMICGPKASGKSTFAKLLTNRLLSPTVDSSLNRISLTNKPMGVAILDLDPGQPEYSAQGQLSLIHLQEPNFGPPFTHPIPNSESRIIRAHTVGAVTPSFDPILYVECALDLFAYYGNLLSTIPKCPLIINTPGWVLGTGLEILMELITKCRPTEVIYMSQDGPHEVVESLREAAKTTPVFTLPSQATEYTTRTSAHLRTMQAISYFHLKPPHKKRLTWDCRPLTSVPPWEIKYCGEGAGILGILCYGEQPQPSLLLEAINGSLVAIVVVDDMAAIPDLGVGNEDAIDQDSNHPGPSAVQSQIQRLQAPLIVRTPKENLPYFNPTNIISLSPVYSHCLGLALVRGIDVPRQRLQVLTPISPKTIRKATEDGKSIVLISGKFDTPGWAYVEELVQRDVTEKEGKKGNVGDGEGDMERVDQETAERIGYGKRKGKSIRDVPWVEELKGSKGRGVGSRVWRVRRDLGKAADGD